MEESLLERLEVGSSSDMGCPRVSPPLTLSRLLLTLLDRIECLVNPFTGDNPATILSFSLLTGEVVVSLGTSDTILLSTTDYAPNPDSHVFAYPANRAGGKRSYMAMLCYKK